MDHLNLDRLVPVEHRPAPQLADGGVLGGEGGGGVLAWGVRRSPAEAAGEGEVGEEPQHGGGPVADAAVAVAVRRDVPPRSRIGDLLSFGFDRWGHGRCGLWGWRSV